MKEEIVTFYTAKLAKEVGFQNKTPHKLRKNYYNYLGELNGDCTAYLKRFVNAEDTSDFVNVEALTQALLQKYLREVHNEHIEVTYMPETKTYSGSLTMRSMGWSGFKTYELALEKCEQEALKLIKQNKIKK